MDNLFDTGGFDINTGHKQFDAQTNLISPGNVVANTEHGWNVRHWNDTGETLMSNLAGKYPPGVLFDFDMKDRKVPVWIKNEIRKVAQSRISGMWLYSFHCFSNGKRVVHGYILTGYEHDLLRTWVTGPTYKSNCVIYTCAKYIAKEKGK